MSNIVFDQKNNNATTTKQKSKHKNPCGSLESNLGPLALQPDAGPLGHRPNFSSYITASMLRVET